MSEDRPSYEPELLEDEAPAAPSPKLSAPARLLAMFTSHGRVFEDIRIRPTWVLVLIAMMVVSVGSQLVVTRHLDFETSIVENMERMGQDLTDEQLDRMVEQAEKLSMIGPLASVVIVPLAMALIAGIFLVTLRAMGGETDFRTTFSAMLHAFWPPGLVSSALTAVIVMRMGTVTQQAMQHAVKSNLGAFLPETAPKWQQALAGSLDLFSIWILVLLVIGFATTARIGKGRAAVAVLVPWAAYVLLKVGAMMLIPGM